MIYDDFLIFENGGRPPSWFLIFKILTVNMLEGVNVRIRTKFRCNPSNRGRDVTIFWIFKFLKILTVMRLERAELRRVPNLVEIRLTTAEIW